MGRLSPKERVTAHKVRELKAQVALLVQLRSHKNAHMKVPAKLTGCTQACNYQIAGLHKIAAHSARQVCIVQW